jgi:hypothetical protein
VWIKAFDIGSSFRFFFRFGCLNGTDVWETEKKTSKTERTDMSKFRQDIVRHSRTLHRSQCIDYGVLETMGDVSNYSCLLPSQIPQVAGIIKGWWKDPMTIVDGNAHIGCDTFHFALLYRTSQVIAVEKNAETCHCLQRNVNRLPLDLRNRITVIEGDIENIIKVLPIVSGSSSSSLHPRIGVFLDPPWGGRNYRQSLSMKLYLGSRSVAAVVQEMLDRNLCHSVILKAPVNFDQAELTQLLLPAYTIETKAVRKTQPTANANANAKGDVYFHLIYIVRTKLSNNDIAK